MTSKIEKLPIPPTSLGEGPHWDTKSQTLYLIDIMEKRLMRYVPATGEVASAQVETEKTVHFIIPVANSPDLFAIATGLKVYIVRWDGKNGSKVEFVKEIMELDKNMPSNMINDAKVDRMGNLFTGTIGIDPKPSDPTESFPVIPTGSFYCRTKDGVLKQNDTGVTASNGIAFDIKRKVLYHVDSFAYVIRRFNYDENTGELSNKTIFFDYKQAGEEGFPDGMTLDTNGNLWVASYQGSNVLNINADTGKEITRIVIPSKLVTSCIFGGRDLDVLYVTTGVDKEASDKGGATYAVTGLGVQGGECYSFPPINL